MSGATLTNNGEDDGDTFKILVATDNHLGYMEKDGCRMNDSLNSFEEILKIARDNEVDFILLGGDLFHENKPSRKSLHGIIKLIRKYCYGDKPCPVAFLSDPSVNFGHTPFPMVNYEDPNVNISIPIFSIHGNHDDPAGQDNLCSLDLLHSAAMINYFGKISSLESIELSPLLLQKGATKMALYGLGSIRDERLHRMFCQKNVKMLRPKEDKEDWFSLFVLHQNRAKHGPKNYIPEEFLDDFLDLVVWGHEHECKIEPTWNGVRNFYVTQPGSSVATSLSDGETREKHVGILLIRGKNFKLKKIKLNTVRQFFMEDIVLRETKIKPQDPDVVKKIESYCSEIMERLLLQAEQERRDNSQIPLKPLIRLRIDYANDDPDNSYELFNMHRFGQKYVDRVANPREIIHFHRRKILSTKSGGDASDDKVNIEVKAESLDSTRVEDMVKEYFLKATKDMQLSLLTEQGISEAVKEFVLKEEKDAIPELVRYQLKKTQDYLVKKKTNEEAVKDEIFRFKEERKKDTGAHDQEIQEAISLARSIRDTTGGPLDDFDDDLDTMIDDDDEPTNRKKGTKEPAKSVERGRGTRGRGTRRGRGARGATKASSNESKLSFENRDGTTRRKAPNFEDSFQISDDDMEDDDATRTASSKSVSSRSTASKKSSKITDMFDKASKTQQTQSINSSRQGGVSQKRKGISFLGDDSDEESEDLFNKYAPKSKKRNLS